MAGEGWRKSSGVGLLVGTREAELWVFSGCRDIDCIVIMALNQVVLVFIVFGPDALVLIDCGEGAVLQQQPYNLDLARENSDARILDPGRRIDINGDVKRLRMEERTLYWSLNVLFSLRKDWNW